MNGIVVSTLLSGRVSSAPVDSCLNIQSLTASRFELKRWASLRPGLQKRAHEPGDCASHRAHPRQRLERPPCDVPPADVGISSAARVVLRLGSALPEWHLQHDLRVPANASYICPSLSDPGLLTGFYLPASPSSGLRLSGRPAVCGLCRLERGVLGSPPVARLRSSSCCQPRQTIICAARQFSDRRVLMRVTQTSRGPQKNLT